MEWDTGALERKWFQTLAWLTPLTPGGVPMEDEGKWVWVTGTGQSNSGLNHYAKVCAYSEVVGGYGEAETVTLPCGNVGRDTWSYSGQMWDFQYVHIPPGFYHSATKKEPIVITRKLRKTFSCGLSPNGFNIMNMSKDGFVPVGSTREVLINKPFRGMSRGGVEVLSDRLAIYKDTLYYLSNSIGTFNSKHTKLYTTSEWVKNVLERKFPKRWEISNG